jgi:hypothetical protein
MYWSPGGRVGDTAREVGRDGMKFTCDVIILLGDVALEVGREGMKFIAVVTRD